MDISLSIKVMIVDDEPLALDDINTIFDWNANGFAIVSKARNGKEAFEAYKKTNPDIVITDVRMPRMDGIELVKKIRKFNMNTRIIFLTSFEYFSYAKEALRLGVKDYILKYEIDEKSIKKVLMPIRDEIVIEKKNSTLRLSRYITEYFNIDLINSVEQYGDSKLSKDINESYYYILLEECMPIPVLKKYALDKWPINSEPGKVLSTCLSYKFNGIHVYCVAVLRPGRYIILISNFNILSQKDRIIQLRSFSVNLSQYLLKTLGNGFTVYFQPLCLPLFEEKNFIKTNLDKFNLCYFSGQGNVYNIDNVQVKTPVHPNDLKKEEIENLIFTRNEATLGQLLDDFCRTVTAESDYAGFSLAADMLMKIINEHCIINWKLEMSSFYEAKPFIDWVKTKFHEIFQIPVDNKNGYSCYVQQAINYIITHYNDPNFSIDQMADEISISIVRLEKLFKQETSMTIIDYVTLFRVKTAKKLLLKGNYKIYEVSDQVGYSSSQYFSKVFKKVVGMSPLDYKLWGNADA